MNEIQDADASFVGEPRPVNMSISLVMSWDLPTVDMRHESGLVFSVPIVVLFDSSLLGDFGLAIGPCYTGAEPGQCEAAFSCQISVESRDLCCIEAEPRTAVECVVDNAKLIAREIIWRPL